MTKKLKHRKTTVQAPSVSVPTIVAENIKQLIASRHAVSAGECWSIRAADKITEFSGSVRCLWFHALWFGVWIAINLSELPGIKAFDPYPFGLLTMIVSLEAIFLSTVLLISQNRLQEAADRRAELDLHINLLAERESTTILRKLARIEQALKIEVCEDEKRHVDELTRETNPVDIVSTIEQNMRGRGAHDPEFSSN